MIGRLVREWGGRQAAAAATTTGLFLRRFWLMVGAKKGSTQGLTNE